MPDMRTRIRDGRGPTTPFVIHDYGDHGQDQGERSWTHPNSRTGSISTIYDVLTPRFVARQKAGEVIINSMSLFKEERGSCHASWSLQPPHPYWGTRTYSGDILPWIEGLTAVSSSPGTPMGDLAGAAIVQAYAKMNTAAISGGEVLKDFHETISMLRKPFQGAQQLIGKMVKHRNQRLGKTLESARRASQSAWLEYRYGWRPLMLDGKKVVEMTQKKFGSGMSRRIVARSGSSYDGEDYLKFECPGPPGANLIYGTRRTKTSVRVSAGVMYEIRNRTAAYDVAKSLGLTLSDVPLTVWEVIPYSFVIDWFANVSGWISAVTPQPDINILGNWVTTITKVETSYTDLEVMTYLAMTPVTTWRVPVGGGSHKSESVVRNAGYSVPNYPPTLNLNLGPSQIVDALALAGQKILLDLKPFKH